MTDDEVDDDVVAAVEGPRQLWELACEAGRNLSQSKLPAADSVAMAELAAESALANEHWPNPVASAHSIIRVGLFAVNDHLRNIARLFESEPVPVYSHLVLVRAAIETAGSVYWLSEAVGPERRVQRYELQRLANANAMALGHAPDSAREKGKAVRANVRMGCELHGWTYRSGNGSQKAQVADEVQPSARQMIDAVLAPPSVTSQMGDLLWWYLSGITHGELHALMQSIQVLESGPMVGEPLAAFSTQAGSVAIMGQAALEGYVRTTERVSELFGWTSPEWSAVVGHTADMGKQIVEAVAEKKRTASGS